MSRIEIFGNGKWTTKEKQENSCNRIELNNPKLRITFDVLPSQTIKKALLAPKIRDQNEYGAKAC